MSAKAGRRAGLGAVVLWVMAAAPTGVVGQVTAGPVPVDTVTVEEAIHRALEVSAQVIQAETGVRTAVMGTRQARANFLPTLSFSSGASLSSSERFDPTTNLRVTGQSNSYNAGISSGVDLFTGGRNVAALRSANAAVDAAEATFIARRFSVAVAVKRTFYQVLRAEDLIVIAEERILQAQENLAAAQRRLQAERATRSDVLRAELQLRNARQSRLEAETQRRISMYALGQAVGVSQPVASRRPESLDPAPLALNAHEMREIVVTEAPAVLSAGASLNVAAASLSQARAQYFPTLGLRGGYNVTNTELALDDARRSWNTSLSLSYPVFNGLQREANVDRANAQVVVAEAQAAEARRSALSDFERLLAALELAEERLALLQESVEVAEEDYRVQQARYEHGASTILELITSQIAMTQAEQDLINARYEYQIAKAELEALVGREL
jgi:outer membrane protein